MADQSRAEVEQLGEPEPVNPGVKYLVKAVALNVGVENSRYEALEKRNRVYYDRLNKVLGKRSFRKTDFEGGVLSISKSDPEASPVVKFAKEGRTESFVVYPSGIQYIDILQPVEKTFLTELGVEIPLPSGTVEPDSRQGLSEEICDKVADLTEIVEKAFSRTQGIK